MDKTIERICNFEELYKAMYKCKKDVMWKDSVAGFVKNGLVNCYKLHDQLKSGSYKIDKYSYFTISEPKVRDIVSTRMKDRVFQRSMCDNYLYTQLTKGLIYDNCACQIDKGTDFAMDRMSCHLQRFFRKHKLDGYVLQCDIANYFGSTQHEVAKKIVIDRVDNDWVKDHVFKIIDSFGTKESPTMGMGLGSQVTQLVQLAIMDDVDHFIKENLKIKQYIRYMDDFVLIHHDKEYLQECKGLIAAKLSDLGLRLNQKKTQIYPINRGIKFLGFRFMLTDTGKVIRKLNKENISRERRKLRKLKGLVDKGILTKKDVNECYQSWKSHANKGNTYQLVRQMDQFYKELWEG